MQKGMSLIASQDEEGHVGGDNNNTRKMLDKVVGGLEGNIWDDEKV